MIAARSGDHAGRTAVVTGAARGLGLAVARELAGQGAHVVLADVDPTVEQVATQLKEEGLDADSACFDVADSADVARAFAHVLEMRGSVDILINNAGLKGNAAPARTMKPSAWDREIAVNLNGAFYCTHEALPAMVERGWGRIISMSSMAGLMGLHGASGYSATKAALLGFTKAIALEGYRSGITANAVCPGVIAVGGPTNPNVGRMLDRIPGERAGRVEDVAYAVSFLASERASFITGVDLPVDAGARLFYTSPSRASR